ncbi:hypothetical protein [Elizabethkingia anophelis]|uniref:hypothetical protein n=1 Tax=Elizabethkingia anophelis TaxID=1117645 RepID=UPI00075086FA|nr:hypothetical protein [Elizabethkingia anophelis]AQW91299.1 hypothetical protein BBD28_11820 [Elizabethkingia anophelis]KUY14165.1 hypothetical protein ATB94_09200 [Elizabethkingia anophelis]
MDKQNRIKNLESQYDRLSANLVELNNEIQILRNSKEISFQELIKAYEFENHNVIILSYNEEGFYTYILGGDGRSMPYDERRIGRVLTVKIAKEYYIPDDYIKRLKEYVKISYHSKIDEIIVECNK